VTSKLPAMKAAPLSVPTDDEVRRALGAVLSKADAGVALEIQRGRSEYRSTFPLENLRVTLAHGGSLRLAFKRLQREGLSRQARLAKPSFLFDPAREPAVYRTVLPDAPAGPPRCFGSVAKGAGETWLFVEWVEGRELYQVGDRALWVHVARWLGDLHGSLAPGLERRVKQARLLEHDAAYYERWIARARRFAAAGGHGSDAARFLDGLAKRYDEIVDALLALPRTVVHGDFFASNVLVAGAADAVRVAPVDWEMAAVGSGLTDLAALISGDWTEAEREQMTAAYASRPGVAPFSSRELDLARLQLAVQCLGWAPADWVAPEGHRHDWLADAVTLAQRLDV
jgi:aminoglycoside phosphotransferase (APT) family kinase protein